MLQTVMVIRVWDMNLISLLSRDFGSCSVKMLRLFESIFHSC